MLFLTRIIQFVGLLDYLNNLFTQKVYNVHWIDLRALLSLFAFLIIEGLINVRVVFSVHMYAIEDFYTYSA